MAARHVLLSSICVILGNLRTVHGAHFELWYGPLPCILLDIDATFHLSMVSQDATLFSLEGATVTYGDSICLGQDRAAMLSLRMFPSNETLKINFRRDISTQSVSMSIALLLDPKQHFVNATGIPFELEDSADLPIGLMNMSYRCNSQQEILFNQDPPYKMTMKITNLHVQAYNIENGQFSPAIECKQDMFTTITPNSIQKFEVKSNNTVCIVVQGEIKFNINYERDDGQPGSVIIMLPRDATVTGQCRYNGTNTTQEFRVNFFDDKWSFSALISQDDEILLKSSSSLLLDLQAEPSYSWKSVELTYVIDERFVDPKESDVSVCPADKSNINNGSNNRTLIIALISVFGSIIVIICVTFTVWRCKKNRNSSGNLHRKPLSNETHTNYDSYSVSIVKGSDEFRETAVNKNTKQQANKRSSTLSRTSGVDEVSGRENQQRTGNSNSDRGKVFDII